MAEALLFAANNTSPDPEKDRRGCWKRGYIVVVRPDGHTWGRLEDPALNAAPRKFVLIKFPGVSVARVEKYLEAQWDDAGGALLEAVMYRRRLWQIQYAELPLAARNKLATTGILVIGPNGDYTWDQVKGFFMRLDTAARETEVMTAAVA
jgi:hypothetical protein